MQTITTRYIADTLKKPSRIKAIASGGSTITISYDSDGDKSHYRAIALLAKKLNWTYTKLVIGDNANNGKVAVMLIDTVLEVRKETLQNKQDTAWISEDTAHLCWQQLDINN